MAAPGPAATPEPPYYAVIFTNRRRNPAPDDEYAETAAHIEQLAARQPGYLGIESVRDDLGITVSYWRDEDSIAAWKANVEHTAARERGRAQWYDEYELRVARVEHAYGFRFDAP